MSDNEQNESQSQKNLAQQNKEKSRTSRFAHLGKMAKVISSNGNKGLMALIVVIAVLVFIFILMLSGGHHHRTAQETQRLGANNNFIFQHNEQRLAEMQAQPQDQRTTMPPAESRANEPQESKAMIARRNAPTQMYSAAPPKTLSGQQGKSSTVFAGKGAFAQYANSQASSSTSVTATRILHPRYTIASGEFVHAALETAINSNLPGMVRAVVTRPVYAYIGERPLIPAGSRLVGQYTSMSSNGSASTRVFVIWNRIITPSGISIMINSPGSDALGRAGMSADAIDHHFFKIFGTATLLSIMGAASANVGVSSSDEPNSADQYRAAIAGAFQSSAQSSLSQNMSIKPTLHVYQGNKVTVFVAQDLDLYSALGSNT